MRARSATVVLVLTAAALLAPAFTRVAAAQSSSRNPAAAQGLYDDARQLVQAGRYAEACPKFKASYELDPGGGTLLNLADCYEKQGKTALAWSTFKEALVVAQRDGHNERVEFAKQHIASLETRLSRLTVQVPAGSRAAGLSIALDGSPLADAAWGVAVPVDPGKHVVRAEAPGKRPFESLIDVPPANAARISVDVPPLADAPNESTPTTTTATTASVAGEGDTKGPHSRATAGWVVGGVGVVALGVASYFGLHAISRWGARNDDCKGGCTADAKTAGDDANRAATIADVGFGVGIVAVAVGAYLVLSGHHEAAPSSQSASQSASQPATALRITPGAVPGGAGAMLRGEW